MNVAESNFVSTLFLTGRRRPNGTLQSTNDSGVFMEDWAEFITFDHRKFSLYEVSSYDNNLEEAKYVC